MKDTSPLSTGTAAGISRRTFLQVGGALGAAAALASFTPGAVPAHAVTSASAGIAPAERPHHTLLGVL